MLQPKFNVQSISACKPISKEYADPPSPQIRLVRTSPEAQNHPTTLFSM